MPNAKLSWSKIAGLNDWVAQSTEGVLRIKVERGLLGLGNNVSLMLRQPGSVEQYVQSVECNDGRKKKADQPVLTADTAASFLMQLADAMFTDGDPTPRREGVPWDYVLVDALAESVSGRMEAGWSLYGEPVVAEGKVWQPMVRTGPRHKL